MKFKMWEKHYGYLTHIHKTPDLREELEETIRAIRTRHMEENQTNELHVPLSKTIENTVKRIEEMSKTYDIHTEGLKIYLTLDASIHSVVVRSTDNIINKPTGFEKKEGKQVFHEPLTGGNLGIVYGRRKMDLINFCEDNIHLLPDSSQEEIREQQRIWRNKSEMDKITNEFEFRVYLASLDDNFDEETIRAHLHHLSWVGKSTEQMYTYYYFLKAIEKKYKDSKTEGYDTILTLSYHKFTRYVNFAQNKGVTESTTRKELVNIMKKDLKFSSRLIEEFPHLLTGDYFKEFIEKEGIPFLGGSREAAS